MKHLTLSFDNGPTPGVTTEVLNVLARYEIRTNFFVCGKDIESPAARAILEQIRAAGHRIGNHTYSHRTVFGRVNDPQAPEKEIGRTQRLLGPLSDPDRLFRPYGGGGYIGAKLLSRAAVDFLRDGGYTCVLWNTVPRDFADPDGWVNTAIEQIEQVSWPLVVLHDIPNGVLKMLPAFLDHLRESNVDIIQDFPPSCVPIIRGEVVLPLDAWLEE